MVTDLRGIKLFSFGKQWLQVDWELNSTYGLGNIYGGRWGRKKQKEPINIGYLRLGSGFRRRRQWHPTPVLLPGKSHGQRSLVGCSPWGHEESDMTEQLHFHFSLSCIGEGNGNPLQCSCLENPRDRGAWWAALYGVAQSWTWLKRLSSSSRGFRKLPAFNS